MADSNGTAKKAKLATWGAKKSAASKRNPKRK